MPHSHQPVTGKTVEYIKYPEKDNRQYRAVWDQFLGIPQLSRYFADRKYKFRFLFGELQAAGTAGVETGRGP